MMNYLVKSVLLVLLLASCAPIAGGLVDIPTSTSPATVVAKNVITPTSSRVPLSSPTQFAKSDPLEGQQCWELKDEIPIDSISRGTILIRNTAKSDNLFLLGLETGKEYKLPYQSKKSVNYNNPQVSPNGNMIAYPEGLIDGNIRKTMLWVVNAHADVLAKILFDQDLFLLRWLDNERLILYTSQTSVDGTVLVVNPFTREKIVVSNDLPNYAASFWPGTDWGVEYSPNLDWAVFIGVLKERDSGPIVRDVVKNQTLWEPQPPISSFDKPKWSPDGQKVAVGASEHLFIIDRNGLAISVPKVNPLSGVATFSWSPDGRYIALWNSDGPQHYTMMVYDIHLEKVMDSCIEDVYPTSPLWSPNSQQIVVKINANQGEPVLIDIQKETAYKLTSIPDVVYPEGWMNSLP